MNGWAGDGWRARKQGSIVYQYVYDPQGSVQERHTDGSYTGGYAAYDRSTFEGYGALRGAYKGSTGAGVGQHDPAGFGGQFGYYTDVETGLLCLTHRYYDPGTGKFLTRDPIGYSGGMNLYGFAEGNPVNESDPNGTSVLSFVLEQGAKRLTKGILKNFLETQIKRKVEKIAIKQFSKRFGKEAFDASAQVDSILNDQWWEVGIGFIPVVGDAFDIADEAIKIKRALSVLDKLQGKFRKSLRFKGKRLEF